jgi:TPR repeat protein
MAGLLVTLWGRGDQTLGARNGSDKASLSRLSASVAGNSLEAESTTARLIIAAAPRALHSDEAAPIGLAVDGAADGAQLLIGGFATGSLFSVGQSISQNTWRLPTSQIEAAIIMPPRGFVGSMEMAVTLMLSNGSLADRRALRLEWLPPASALPPSGMLSRRIDARQLDALLARGNALEVTGDLAGARLVFQRAAEAGNARAAFMLAETYDPIVLEKLGELGLASDVQAARIWYGKAKELGSEEALRRLQRLAHRLD